MKNKSKSEPKASFVEVQKKKLQKAISESESEESDAEKTSISNEEEIDESDQEEQEGGPSSGAHISSSSASQIVSQVEGVRQPNPFKLNQQDPIYMSAPIFFKVNNLQER